MGVLIIIALQYIVSAKAGFVNYVDGQVNVQAHHQVAVAMPIETGPRSHIELLLNRIIPSRGRAVQSCVRFD